MVSLSDDIGLRIRQQSLGGACHNMPGNRRLQIVLTDMDKVEFSSGNINTVGARSTRTYQVYKVSNFSRFLPCHGVSSDQSSRVHLHLPRY